MAYLDPQEAFDHFQKKVVEGVEQQFPVKGKQRSLHLERVEVPEPPSPDDIKAQQQAKIDGKSWGVPVYAHLTLKDNATGKIVDKRKVRVAEVPMMTKRYSYIVGGQEYQVDSQWQLKPGAYTRRKQNQQLETQFNTTGPGSKTFHLNFHPDKKQFTVRWNKADIPAYPILKTLGVTDEQLKKSWGEDILDANKNARGVDGALAALYRSDRGRNPENIEQAKEHLWDTLQASKMDKSATHMTLGRPFEHVNGDALHIASKRLLDVQRGGGEDDRDSLVFKRLRTAGDFALDKMNSQKWAVQNKMAKKLDTAQSVRDVVKFEHLNTAVHKTFSENQASRVASQINPLEMVSSSMQTTVMGPGGIQSEHAVIDQTKWINPSQFGFLDPINTPEGPKTGVTLRLPMGVRKKGDEPRIALTNMQTGKTEFVSPGRAMQENVLLPDQVEWKDGKPNPINGKKSKILGPGNELQVGDASKAKYVMRHPTQVFNITSNMIPYLHSTQGNRAGMASRHLEQAVSLEGRQAPLVQVATGAGKGPYDTFEGMVGAMSGHQSPIDGTVEKVTKDGIHIRGKDGVKHTVQLYNHYPLNDVKSTMHSEPLVKPGDVVKKGQHIGDTNFTKDGKLALGTNLRVAYAPLKGYNFEDGVVISESAAKAMSSVHMTKHSLAVEPDMNFDPKRFRALHAGTYKTEQLDKVGEDGVVAVGTRVKPGDPLVLATQPFKIKDRTGIGAWKKNMSGVHTDKSVKWDGDYEGEVVGVHRKGKSVQVHVRTVEPMQVGDKLSGRYGNKGIVTKILDNSQMPRTKDGSHVEVMLNPAGIPGRINPSQVFETVAAKVADKTGKPIVVQNFKPHVDQLQEIKNLAKAHGVSDTEELYDPETNQSLGQILTGKQYMLKLVHQVEKKGAVRSGMSLPGTDPESYDRNLQPTGGGHHGGQSMGSLGMYAMLAHGAKANIREMQTYKSEGPDPAPAEAKKWKSQHNEVWQAIQNGSPLPPPKPSFAFSKFNDYLKASGVNMEKNGHRFVLTPMTDKQIRDMSAGKLPKPDRKLSYKLDKDGNPMPVKGGLFDERITGGHDGKNWSHIELAEPIPNPVFEAPVRALTGLTQKQFNDVMAGRAGVTPGGAFTDNPRAGLTGGHAIKSMLKKVDVQADLERAKAELKSTPKTKVDATLKKVKYLEALNRTGHTAEEAYILHNLPVIPPKLRPVSILPDGSLNEADLNGLYSDFGQLNAQMGDPVIRNKLPEERKANLRGAYYDGVKALMGIGIAHKDQKQKGLLNQIHGPEPKKGFFQKTLMNRRQDLTMRSTIVPEPSLGLDEVGIPEHYAMDLFRPFVVKQLVQSGSAKFDLDAHKMIKANDPLAKKALERVMDDKPVLLKRDPALHKYNVQGFKPRLVEGKAIKIHPLTCSGYNADFDGDTMSVYVPISREAEAEAHKMMPSNNLFSDSTGKVMYQPTHESALGLYKLTRVDKKTNKTFANPGDAIKAAQAGKIGVTDLVSIKGTGQTTAGRLLVAAALPQDMQKQIVNDHKFVLDKKGLNTMLTTLAKQSGGLQEGQRNTYGQYVDRLKDLGNGAASGMAPVYFDKSPGNNVLDPKKQQFVRMDAHTLNLNDLSPDKATRDRILADTQKKVDAVGKMSLSQAEKDRRAVDLWTQADKTMGMAHKRKMMQKPNNLGIMNMSGGKPNWDQYKQFTLAPMLVTDTSGKTVPIPVDKSFSEGQDVSGYWVGMYGARMGAVRKVQEVQEPGVITKAMQNTTMDNLIVDHDCGTTGGVSLNVHDRSIEGRHLASDFKHGKLHVPAGTVLSPDIIGQIRSVKKDANLVVRSPLKCQHEKGMCQKCMGIGPDGKHYEVGTNVGVMAAHSLGEKTTQMMLNSFHTGGVATGRKDPFEQFKQLVNLPEKVPNEATLAVRSGTITKVEPHKLGAYVYIDGQPHFVGRDRGGKPLNESLPVPGFSYVPWQPPKAGMKVKAGQILSDPNRTTINPHHLHQATGKIDVVRNHLSNEIYGLYKDHGVDRKHVDVLVNSMTSTTKVVDPGGSDVLRSEYRNTNWVKNQNKLLRAQGQPTVQHAPILKGINEMPLHMREDWMAKLQHQKLKQTILEAAATGGSTSLHGPHPVPGMAYGAEFGMTSKDALRPGKSHLKDVEPYHY